jgi:hypothetical protein
MASSTLDLRAPILKVAGNAVVSWQELLCLKAEGWTGEGEESLLDSMRAEREEALASVQATFFKGASNSSVSPL